MEINICPSSRYIRMCEKYYNKCKNYVGAESRKWLRLTEDSRIDTNWVGLENFAAGVRGSMSQFEGTAGAHAEDVIKQMNENV